MELQCALKWKLNGSKTLKTILFTTFWDILSLRFNLSQVCYITNCIFFLHRTVCVVIVNAVFPYPMHISKVSSVQHVEKLKIQISAWPHEHSSHPSQMMIGTQEKPKVPSQFLVLF